MFSINLQNAGAKAALFGNGTQSGGLIDSKNILVGGTADTLGAALTAESLTDLMGLTPTPSNVQSMKSWVEPLQQAMQEFGIVTPKQITAFLAEIKQESGGLHKLKEGMAYTSVESAAKHFSAFGVWHYTKPNPNNDPTIAAYNLAAPAHNATVEDNVRYFYEHDLGLTADPHSARMKYSTGWTDPTDSVQLKMAEHVYGSTTPKGIELGNLAAGDGAKYRGYGLIQLTGLTNVKGFADYVDLHPFAGQSTGQQILADPKDTIGTDFALAARSAAWYWSTKHALTAQKSFDGKLNDKALTINWTAQGVDPNQQSAFYEISRGIGSDAFPDRWTNYIHDVKGALVGGNPYEDMRAVMASLGLSAQGARATKGSSASL